MKRIVKWLIIISLLNGCTIGCSLSTKGIQLNDPGVDIKVDTNLTGEQKYVA